MQHITASAPKAIALIKSAEYRIDPPAIRVISSRKFSCLNRSSTEAIASSIGIPAWSRIILGAAPVPPLNPSRVRKSAPPLTIPTAIGAEL